MSDPLPGAAPSLRRTLTVRDLVLFNIVAVLGLRWLATAAKSGPSALVLWALAGVMFFIPQGLAVSELSARHPDEGGIYFWTKRQFGERHGFFCGWCYWVVNVLYYPNLLISTAVIATYALGRGNSTLGESWAYVLTTTLAALWLAVWLNVLGLKTGRWLQNAGGIGSYVTGIVLIAIGAWGWMHVPSANAFTVRSLVPDFTSFAQVNLWATIAFAFAGLELSATLGGEIIEPRRALPRAIYLSAPLIAGAYMLGTASVLWLVPVGDVNLVAGFLQGIDLGAKQIAPWLWWLAPFAALAYTVGNVGGVGAWLTGPARVAFMIGLDRYFPPAFARTHPRWGTPYVAIIVQASLATIFLLLSVLGRGTTVEKAYLILLDTQLLIYFVPYIYLFLVLLLERPPAAARSLIPGGAAGRLVAGVSGLFVTFFAMAMAMVPPSPAEAALFETKVVGGALLFFVTGGLIYRRGVRRVAA